MATEGSIESWIREQWEKGDLALARERRDYWLNYAFIEGEQWVWWHPQHREVAEFPRTGDRDRVRLVANRMQPNLVTLLAKMCKRTLAFEVLADSADDAALGASRLAEHLCEAARVDDGWEAVRRDNLWNCFLGGTSAIVVEWDPRCGEALGVNPESGQIVWEGNAKLSALAITEFTLEPGTKDPRDSRWVIIATAMPPGQAREKYGLDHDPAADTALNAGPLQRRLWNERGWPTNVELCTVFTFYKRPAGNDPGRHVVTIGDEVIHDGPWPFPWKDRLNLHVFREKQLPKRWTGHTMLNDARPLQVAFNHAISNLSEHMKLAGNARLAVPDTSGIEDEDLTDTPGEIVRYDGTASAPPGYIAPPNLPRWLIDHANRLESQIDDVMAVHDISRGQAPGDRNSGLALSVLAEKDETPLGMVAHDQSEGWGNLASMSLELWEAKVPEQRTTRVITDTGVPITKRWTGKMLRGQTRATMPLENALPHSRAALQAWMMSVAEKFPQAMPQNPAVLARMLDLPVASLYGEMADPDVAQAQHENYLMSVGTVPALGDDPFPQEFDNHAAHIAEHNRFRKGRAYMYADESIRQLVDAHVAAHERLALDETLDQAKLNAAQPGAGAVPQANQPPGSAVPPDFAMRQALAQGAPAQPGAMPALPPGTAPV